MVARLYKLYKRWKDGLYIVDVGNGIAGGSPSNPVAVANYRYKTGANHAAFPFKSKSTGKFSSSVIIWCPGEAQELYYC